VIDIQSLFCAQLVSVVESFSSANLEWALPIAMPGVRVQESSYLRTVSEAGPRIRRSSPFAHHSAQRIRGPGT
jgi:hypothetical protein